MSENEEEEINLLCSSEKQPTASGSHMRLVLRTNRGEIIVPKEGDVMDCIPRFNKLQILEWKRKNKMEKATTALALWTWAVQWDKNHNHPRVIREKSGASYYLCVRPNEKKQENRNYFTAVLTITHKEIKTTFRLYGRLEEASSTTALSL